MLDSTSPAIHREPRRGSMTPTRGWGALAAAGIAVLVLAPAGCGNDSGDQQAAIDQARREGAQTARQNAKIRDLEQQLKEVEKSAKSDQGGLVPSSGVRAGQAPTPPAVSSYVANYQPYSPTDPDFYYVAEVPAGGGWSPPAEGYPTNGELLRTTLRGPDGTLLIIDYTPNEVPQLGGSYDAASSSLQTNFGTATEYVFSRSEALPDCNGRPCADFFVNDGSGGGWGVLGGGPSLAVAEGIAAHVAQSITFGD